MKGRKANGKPMCVGAGFVVLDVVRPTWREGRELRFAGGSCGNVVTILSFLGWKSSVVARIGEDLAGRQLVQDLEGWAVDTRLLIHEEEARTPAVFQRLYNDRNGHAQHSFSRYCSICGEWAVRYRPVRLRDVDTAAEFASSARVFYFDRVAPAYAELARRARGEGALVVFEPSGVKDPRLFLECLRSAHVFKYSHERFDSHADLISEALVPVVIETNGASGLRVTVRRKGRVAVNEEMPAVPAPRVVDAAGSGDWCTAGLIHGIVRQHVGVGELADASKVVLDALRYAQSLAALNCAFEGARGVMYRMTKRRLLNAAGALLEGRRVRLPNGVDDPVAEPQKGTSCVVCDRSL